MCNSLVQVETILNNTRRNQKKGLLFVVSAPSGAGKTTLCRKLVEDVEGAVYSISTTSRSPRPAEKDGYDYFFVSREKFMEKVKGSCMMEWAEVHGNLYGTEKKFIEENLASGRHVICDLDVQGAEKVKNEYKETVLIFILPPSASELRARLEKRKQDSIEEIKKRLENSYAEMARSDKYDYYIINEDFNVALSEMKSIISAEKCRNRWR